MNPYQNNPYQNNPYQNNPYQQNPYQNNPNQYPQNNNQQQQQYPSYNQYPNYNQQYANQNDPYSLLEFQFSCELESKILSTPKKIKFMINEDERGYKLIGETEELTGHEIQFSKSFKINYHFERKQSLKVILYENRVEELGTVVSEVSNIISQQGQMLKSKIEKGTISVFCEEVYQPPSWTKDDNNNVDYSNWDPNQVFGDPLNVLDKMLPNITKETLTLKEKITFNASAKNLDKKDFFGKSDPFFRILKSREGSEPIKVYESEVIKKTLNPDWKEFEISPQKLCNNDESRTIIIEVYDWNSIQDSELIGSFQTCLSDLKTKKEFPIHNAMLAEKAHKKKKNYTNSGQFIVQKFAVNSREKMKKNPVYEKLHNFKQQLQRKADYAYRQINNPYSFIQYLSAGLQMHMMIAIDFTGSNGHYLDEISLHYIQDNKKNPYQMAIRSIGDIISVYDKSKLFPSYIFGALVGEEVSDCFPLNMDNEIIKGMDSVMRNYEESVALWPFSGPTHFSGVINKVIEHAKERKSERDYYTLLILTDGILDDFVQTKKAIINASALPVSIIIVGVGDADFSKMDDLDADEKPLEYNGQKALRDIVQFVPFNQFKNDPKKLAETTLKELPDQVRQYYGLKGISPQQLGN